LPTRCADLTEVRAATPSSRLRRFGSPPEPANIVTDEQLAQMAQQWGVPQISPADLRHALTHSSAVTYRSADSNERLEFLGDSIVNAVIAEFLYHQYPDRTEGDLAKGRALVVSKAALYEAGVRLGLPEVVVVGANTEGLLARSRRSMTADALEALFAIVYLRLGWESVRRFILSVLAPELDGVRQRADLRDAKTILQEQAQSQRLPSPIYRTIDEQGEAHNRTFTCEVTLHDGTTATGTGRSKKDAQQMAAATALAILDSE